MAIQIVLDRDGLQASAQEQGDYDLALFASFGDMPAVTDATDRDNRFPASTAPIGTTVRNLASRCIERLRRDRTWTIDVEAPTGIINPRAFAIASWYDANGACLLGSGQIHMLSPDDLAANVHRWRGTYFAGRDTIDYVALQEALYAAYARDSKLGNIQWGSHNGVFIPAGSWFITRALWLACSNGINIRGASQLGTNIFQISADTSALYTDGFAYGYIADLSFSRAQLRQRFPQSTMYKAVVDMDSIGNSAPYGNQLSRVAEDLEPRTVVDSGMPMLKRAGSGWKINEWKDKLIVVVADPATPSSPGQVRRIVENTEDTLYIAGRWDWAPGPDTEFVLDPVVASWGRWHGATWMTDWLTDFNTLPVNPDGLTLREFHNPRVFAPNMRSQVVTVTSHTQHTLHHDGWQWPPAEQPWPNVGLATDFSSRFLGANNIAEDSTLVTPQCSYVLGGTFYDNANGEHPITSDNTNWLILDGTNWTDNEKVGAYVQVVESSDGLLPTPITSENNRVITIAGLHRIPGADKGKYLTCVATIGADSNDPRLNTMRLILDNTEDSFTIDESIGLGGGDSIMVTDLALGTILPIALNTATRIDTVWETGMGVNRRAFWSVRPKPGSKVNVLARTDTQLVHGSHFRNVGVSDHADTAWAWVKSGDASMGSETTWTDCSVYAKRIGFWGNSLNMIDCHWFGGSGSANVHSFYIARGSMNWQGIGMGTDIRRQTGADILLNYLSRNHTVCSSVYSESRMMISSTSPAVLLNCQHAQYLEGYSLAHTWTEGEYWRPQNHKGRMLICVEVVGSGSTASIAEPRVVAEGYDPFVSLVDDHGNGARFVRCDWIVFGGDLNIVGGSCGLGQIYGHNQLTVIGMQASRPDWIGTVMNGLNTNPPSRGVANAFGVVVNPEIVGGESGILPWSPFYGTEPTNYDPQYHPNVFGGPLVFGLWRDGNALQTGFFPVHPLDFDQFNAVLGLMDSDNAAGTSMSSQYPVILGKRPRVGVNRPGSDMRIAGGAGTGSGASGRLRFAVIPGGEAGETPNVTPIDVAALDDDTTSGNTRLLLYDVDKGTLVRVSLGEANSAGLGFKILRVPN